MLWTRSADSVWNFTHLHTAALFDLALFLRSKWLIPRIAILNETMMNNLIVGILWNTLNILNMVDQSAKTIKNEVGRKDAKKVKLPIEISFQAVFKICDVLFGINFPPSSAIFCWGRKPCFGHSFVAGQLLFTGHFFVGLQQH